QQLDPPALAALREGADLLASLVDDPALETGALRQQIMVTFADITETFTSSLSAKPDKDIPADREDEEDELFLQEQDVADDDLFGDAVAELDESSEENLFSPEREQDEAPDTSDAEADAEAIDPELLECFQEETEEHLESIDTCLKTLSEHITDAVELTPSAQETLHVFRRAVHTLKGAAAVIGIESVAAWGRDFEDFLDWLHDEAKRLDPSTIALLREGADLLASLAHDPAFPAEKEQQRLTAIFADITEAFAAGTEEPGKAEKEGSPDVFAEIEQEGGAGADDFFDGITDDPVSADEDDALFQDAEEDGDLFGSVLAGLSEAAEAPDLFPSETADSEPAAEAIDPELLECFREETDEHLENIDDCLNQLAREITVPMELSPTSRETLHSLRRSVHTLKGAAAVIGIEQIAAWGHDFEDFLDWLHDEARKLAPPVIPLLREGLISAPHHAASR
ncbi:MAG: hypothetical protein D3906_14765, partial [Candidatus Electrothrix sp. AUS1_2]|nr:hypothetical protein [Candidatus Electrothrix sp. AUS1_2]